MKNLTKNTNVGLPAWANNRPGWTFCGWIKNPPSFGNFDEMVTAAKVSDHGELRAVDIYSQGAVCWFKEQKKQAIDGQ